MVVPMLANTLLHPFIHRERAYCRINGRKKNMSLLDPESKEEINKFLEDTNKVLHQDINSFEEEKSNNE